MKYPPLLENTRKLLTGPGERSNVQFPGTQSETMKFNCDETVIYSINDDQCNALCSGPNSYRTKNGVCVNDLIFEKTDAQNKCSSKDGLIAYLAGDTQFGKTNSICLSMDLGIRPDNPFESNILCRKGDIDIDYNKAFPTLDNCTCTNPDDILIIIPNTSTTRTHGICVNKNTYDLFAFNDQIYNQKSKAYNLLRY